MRKSQIFYVIASAMLLTGVLAQTPNNTQRFDKDGLSFDYPAGWTMRDKSTPQMQFVELLKGDVVIRVRSPREPLTTPEKEAHAKKLFQDKYIDDFVDQVQQEGMQPNRSTTATKISGSDADGTSVRFVMGGVRGGMDSYYCILSGRLVNLSIITSEKDMKANALVWDTIRNSVKVEPAATTKPGPQPTPSPRKP